MISVHVFLQAVLVAAAALALWATVRFPRLGPTSLTSAIGICAAAFLVLQVCPLAVSGAVHLPYGLYVAVFGCVLPGFVFAFLGTAWLMRSLIRRLGGTGGGPGRLVPSSRAY